MIYLDTSVALAHLLAEDRQLPDAMWSETLVASRVMEYEVWTRLNARGLEKSHGEAARALIGRVAFVELIADIVARVREPFPSAVRTLDALHLATVTFLLNHGQSVQLATFDQRLALVARKLKFQLYPL